MTLRQKIIELFVLYPSGKWRKGVMALLDELKEMDFGQWYFDNVSNIMRRFDLHSASGISPKECLRYFVEKEILGIE